MEYYVMMLDLVAGNDACICLSDCNSVIAAGVRVICIVNVHLHCVSKKTGPLLPFAITPTVLVQ